MGLRYVVVAFAIGCGGSSGGARPPGVEAIGQTKCSVAKSSQRPLVVEWPAADRASLEATAKRGVVAVRYDGCEMEVLSSCVIPGKYNYVAVERQSEQIAIKNADDLYAK